MDGTLYEVLKHVQRHHAILYWAAPAVAAPVRQAHFARRAEGMSHALERFT